MCDEPTRRGSNISGKGGKTPLNPDIAVCLISHHAALSSSGF